MNSNPFLSCKQSNASSVNVYTDDNGQHVFGAYLSTPWAACRDGCRCLKPAADPSCPEALGSTTGNRPEKHPFHLDANQSATVPPLTAAVKKHFSIQLRNATDQGLIRKSIKHRGGRRTDRGDEAAVPLQNYVYVLHHTQKVEETSTE